MFNIFKRNNNSKEDGHLEPEVIRDSPDKHKEIYVIDRKKNCDGMINFCCEIIKFYNDFYDININIEDRNQKNRDFFSILLGVSTVSAIFWLRFVRYENSNIKQNEPLEAIMDLNILTIRAFAIEMLYQYKNIDINEKNYEEYRENVLNTEDKFIEMYLYLAESFPPVNDILLECKNNYQSNINENLLNMQHKITKILTNRRQSSPDLEKMILSVVKFIYDLDIKLGVRFV